MNISDEKRFIGSRDALRKYVIRRTHARTKSVLQAAQQRWAFSAPQDGPETGIGSGLRLRRMHPSGRHRRLGRTDCSRNG